jgi:hypothetical protein
MSPRRRRGNEKDCVDNHSNYLRLQFHTITKMNGQLSDIPECMLIRGLMIETENLRSGVFHEGDGRQGMGVGIPRRFH